MKVTFATKNFDFAATYYYVKQLYSVPMNKFIIFSARKYLIRECAPISVRTMKENFTTVEKVN